MKGVLRLLAKLEAIVGRFSSISGKMASCCLLGVVFLVFAEVIVRRILLKTFMATELSAYGLVAITFLGLATTLSAERHLRIEFLISRLPKRKRILLLGSTSVVAFGYVMVLLTCFVLYVLTTYQIGTRSLSLLQVPLYIPRSLMVIGTAIFALQLIPYIIRLFKAHGKC